MKITVLDGYGLNPGDLSWKAIEELGTLTVYDRTPAEEIVARSQGAEIILTNKTPLTRETLQQLPDLRLVGVLATGYNVVDTQAARQMGITVSNIPAYSTASVAQMVFAHLLAITNRVEHYTQCICQQDAWCQSPDFCFWNTPLVELAGLRMGIVGMGRIGQAVARIALAMGMEVVAMTSKTPDQLPQGVTAVDRDQLFATCDVLSLHCPLTPTTQNLVCAETLALMKPQAIIINTSRGPVVNEQNMADALHAGRIAAYGTDVLTVEPALPNNPLLHAPRVFVTPHIAWATRQARQRLMDILTENIRAYQAGSPINVVN